MKTDFESDAWLCDFVNRNHVTKENIQAMMGIGRLLNESN